MGTDMKVKGKIYFILAVLLLIMFFILAILTVSNGAEMGRLRMGCDGTCERLNMTGESYLNTNMDCTCKSMLVTRIE
jgi:hypothetical protein